jgi:outer membrane lipoprotein SlyB
MKKIFMTTTLLAVLALTGCASGDIQRANKEGCRNGTSYGGAALGALGGAAVGSLIGGGTGNTLATVGGAVAGGYAGSKTNVGCD